MQIESKQIRKAEVNAECVACGCCIKVCPRDAIRIFRGVRALIDTRKCAGCGKCSGECPAGIIKIIEVKQVSP